jgi:hypothetical protein
MLTKENPWNKTNPPHIYRNNFPLCKTVFLTDLSTGLISRTFTITFTNAFLSNHMLVHSLIGYDRLLPNCSEVTSQSCAEGALTSAVRAVTFKEVKAKQVVDNYEAYSESKYRFAVKKFEYGFVQKFNVIRVYILQNIFPRIRRHYWGNYPREGGGGTRFCIPS